MYCVLSDLQLGVSGCNTISFMVDHGVNSLMNRVHKTGYEGDSHTARKHCQCQRKQIGANCQGRNHFEIHCQIINSVSSFQWESFSFLCAELINERTIAAMWQSQAFWSVPLWKIISFYLRFHRSESVFPFYVAHQSKNCCKTRCEKFGGATETREVKDLLGPAERLMCLFDRPIWNNYIKTESGIKIPCGQS